MTITTSWRIPPSMEELLTLAPRDQPAVLLLRHSVRDALPPGRAAYVLPITAPGRQIAQELGALLAGRLQSLRTSPLTRCVQTAEALRDGAGVQLSIDHDRLLGDPGAFVLDGGRAWKNWEERGHEGVMTHLVAEDSPLSGMARPGFAARFLVHHMLAAAGDAPGLHVFVSHDSLVLATAARLTGQPLGPEFWPWFLEGALFWRDQDGVHTAYRDLRSTQPPPTLCGITDDDVVEFARREIAATVGLNCNARFFLAGGAFKTLLTGRPPRDLDLWAPSVQDREALLATLVQRGAVAQPPRPFADAFLVGDRIVEVPHSTGPETLPERLARSDLALSAIGAEHRPGDRWKAVIHPLAILSVRTRQVLLLKPLVNWKYALTTLERMRRYAAELGFDSPAREEAEIWRVFECQTAEVQTGMLERYARTGADSFGVAAEVACRRR